MTPHLAASTAEAQDRAGVIVAEQVAAALEGGLVTNAVNIPTLRAEDLEVLGSIGKAIHHPDTIPEFYAKTAGPTYYQIDPTDGQVLDLTHGHKSGSVTMSKPDSHTVSATFKPQAIGSPGSYHWYALIGACTVYDRAPDTGFAPSKRC